MFNRGVQLPSRRGAFFQCKFRCKTIAIQRRVDNLAERHYDRVVCVMEYLNELSFTVTKQKQCLEIFGIFPFD